MSATAIRYRFGPFLLALPQMSLTCGGDPVKLGGRALNLLAVLAEAGGELVPRSDLLERVWPGQAIDESAIRVHISAARKALAEGGAGDNAIVNEAGRGYRLAVPVERDGEDAPVRPAAGHAGRTVATLPARLGSVWGRDEVVAALARELTQRRCVTIAGPGGIGKTTAALAVGRTVAEAVGLTAYFIDLAPVIDPSTVPSAVATALGLPGSGPDLIHRIVDAVSIAPSLLLFDNCEQVVDAAAELVEDLLRQVPTLRVLATSREPLRTEGEWVHRLSALDVPPAKDVGDPETATAYAAVSLFCERAQAANPSFLLDSSSLPAVSEICRRLDGIPLAIEFAAARCDVMDPSMIAEGLDDRFGLLTRGRRTALARHRTLRAALDWSYDLLDPFAQRLLDRLALFREAFGTEAAMAMAADAGLTPSTARSALTDLVAKSLLNSAFTPAGVRYRLLDTTRQYGLERLEDRNEVAEARQAHSGYLLRHFAQSAEAWEGKAPREWLATHSGHIDDARSAMAWAGAEGGDPTLAVRLVIASAPLWFHLSLAREFLGHAETAIAASASASTSEPVDAELQVELLSAYGHALWHTKGPVSAMGEAFQRALSLAEGLESPGLTLRALWGFWAYLILSGDYGGSLGPARRFADLAASAGDLASRQTAAHMFALSYHFAGDHEAAAIHLEEVLAGDAVPERANHANHAQVDGRIAALSLLMRLRWLQQPGGMDEAMALALECAEDAVRIDHALSACYGLSIGCIPVAMAAGETALAEKWIETLAGHTVRHGLDHWHAFVVGYGSAIRGRLEIPANATEMQREMFLAAAGQPETVGWLHG